MAGINLQGIEKSFGPTRVLNGIDLDIRDGEFLTLVGPSGCGKSTLLRILAGLEAPNSGNIAIDGQNVSNVRAAGRNLAMVFQSYALYPHLTVAENMMTPLKLRDLNWRERMPLAGPLFARNKYKALLEQVRETAKVLKIEPLLDRKPGQMSGGQRQRAALGRAMVRKPVAFLMDEPLSNLDAALRVHMRSELADLHRSLATTFVYVTHDQAEALTMSDRMAVMMNGEILQLDTPEEIYHNPNHADVATFVGSPKINMLPAQTTSDGLVSSLGVEIGRSSEPVVQIGFRCEQVSLAYETDEASWAARIVYLENMGSDLFIHCILDSANIRVIARSQPNTSFEIGQSVSVKVGTGKIMGFGEDKRQVLLQPLSETSSKAGRRLNSRPGIAA